MGDYTAAPSPGKIKTALWGLQYLGSNVQFAEGCVDSLTPCVNYSAQDVKQAAIGTDVNFVLVGTGNNKIAVARVTVFSSLSILN